MRMLSDKCDDLKFIVMTAKSAQPVEANIDREAHAELPTNVNSGCDESELLPVTYGQQANAMSHQGKSLSGAEPFQRIDVMNPAHTNIAILPGSRQEKRTSTRRRFYTIMLCDAARLRAF
jgi:hypothetical protein